MRLESRKEGVRKWPVKGGSAKRKELTLDIQSTGRVSLFKPYYGEESPMASPVIVPPTVYSKPNAIIPINNAHPEPNNASTDMRDVR